MCNSVRPYFDKDNVIFLVETIILKTKLCRLFKKSLNLLFLGDEYDIYGFLKGNDLKCFKMRPES